MAGMMSIDLMGVPRCYRERRFFEVFRRSTTLVLSLRKYHKAVKSHRKVEAAGEKDRTLRPAVSSAAKRASGSFEDHSISRSNEPAIRHTSFGNLCLSSEILNDQTNSREHSVHLLARAQVAVYREPSLANARGLPLLTHEYDSREAEQ